MIDFGATLLNMLHNSSSEAYWVMKLYYNQADGQAFQADGTTPNLAAEAIDDSETNIIIDYPDQLIALVAAGSVHVRIDSEIMKVTAAGFVPNNMTVVRGARGTTAATHADNSPIYFAQYIGISDKDRVISDVQYHGPVKWGSLTQKADPFNWTVSPAKMSVTIDNTLQAFAGERFTDLFATRQFSGRRWELFMGSGEGDDAVLADNSHGAGLVTDDYEGDQGSVTLHLTDLTAQFDVPIPAATVDEATHPNAPANNIGKVIPMAYGGFDRATSVSSIPFDRVTVAERFPAIITDKTVLTALPDTETMSALRDRNVFMRVGDLWAACDDGNVTTTAATPDIDFSGAVWYVRVPITTHTDADALGTDVAKLYNAAILDTGTLATKDGGPVATYLFHLEPTSISGEIAEITLYISIESFDNNGDPNVGAYYTPGETYTPIEIFTLAPTSVQTVSFAGVEAPGVGANIKIVVFDLGTSDFVLNEIFVEIKMSPRETFTRTIPYTEETVVLSGGGRTGEALGGARTGLEVVTRERKVSSPADIDYIYCNGGGREYNARIDTINGNPRNDENGASSDPGYGASSRVDNPVYIVENMLTTDGRFDSGDTGAELDLFSFDRSGNTTDGAIGDVFNAAAVTVRFSFSQNKPTTAMKFAQKIGAQCGTLFFASGDGKVKCSTRRRAADWNSTHVDMTLHYGDLKIISVERTPLNWVRNKIVTSYDISYATGRPTAVTAGSEDATSQGNGVGGYGQTLILEREMDRVSSTVIAEAYEDAQLDYWKDRKSDLTVETAYGPAQALEMGDLVNIDEWPADYKVYGAALTTSNYFWVIDTSKKGPSVTRLELMEVS